MLTKIIHPGNANHFDSALLSEAVEKLNTDQVVAIPTETVYGLAANALHSIAVKRIFEAKCRPTDNPLIVHISSLSMLESLIEKPLNYSLFETLISAFWPGPLTLLFPKNDKIPDEVTAGLPTVAIRFPSHPITLSIIEQCNFPLAAPSANLSGRPSPTEASHVYDDLQGKIPLIIDGGICSKGVESTVVNLLSDPPIILRPGSITIEMLKEYIPNIQVHRSSKKDEIDPISSVLEISLSSERPLSPGMKYKHYAPEANFFLLDRNYFSNNILLRMIPTLKEYCERNHICGSILLEPITNNACNSDDRNLIIYHFSSSSYEIIARELFSKLRTLDAKSVDFILMATVTEDNEGFAIMNRILKASHSVLQSEYNLFSCLDEILGKGNGQITAK